MPALLHAFSLSNLGFWLEYFNKIKEPLFLMYNFIKISRLESHLHEIFLHTIFLFFCFSVTLCSVLLGAWQSWFTIPMYTSQPMQRRMRTKKKKLPCKDTMQEFNRSLPSHYWIEFSEGVLTSCKDVWDIKSLTRKLCAQLKPRGLIIKKEKGRMDTGE